MNKSFTLRAALAATSLLTLTMVHAAGLSDADYSSGKTRIQTELSSDKARCATLAGNANDICIEQAKGRSTIAQAELEFAHSGKPEDQNRILIVRAEAAYAVAREKCDDRAGNVKDVCVEQAKAIETKALSEAKLGKKVVQATTAATTEMLDADYKVAAEKCDVYAGQAKTDCVNTAKTTYGKQ